MTREFFASGFPYGAERIVNGQAEIAPRWLTIDQAAQYTGFAKSTLYHMVSDRRIPFIKKGGRLRFDKEKLDAWMAEGTNEPLNLTRDW